VISAALADELLQQYEGLGWDIKAALVHAATLAHDDDEFRRVADPEMLKVGPKGYIHGWIFVGAPGVGARVFHPQHGMGTVSKHNGSHVNVKFDKSGATHSFEAREHTAKGKLVARAKEEEKEAGKDVDGKNYEGLKHEAMRYNAASPRKEGSNVRLYDDPDRVKEAIRLHTAARRAAPDAKSKKLHTDEIDRHKNYLGHIENNQNITRYEKDSKQAREDIKQLERTNHGSDADHYDAMAEAHQRLADVERRRNKELGRPDDYASQTVTNHEYLANAMRGNATQVREEQDARKKSIAERIPQAEKAVDEREATARRTGKKDDVDRAVAGHGEIAARANDIGRGDIAEKHGQAAAQLREDFINGKLKKPSKSRSKVPGLTEEGAKEPKVKSPWGEMHPADLQLHHPGAFLTTTEEHQSALRELDRRGATPDGKDKISRTRRQVAKDLAQHERAHAEYIKPGGRGDYDTAVREARQADKDAEAKGTADAHQAAADAHRKATTLAYTHNYNGASFHSQMNQLHQRSANQKRAEEAAKNPPKAAPAPKTPKPRKAAAAKEQTPDDLSKKARRTGTREDHVKASIAHHQAGNRHKAGDHRKAVESIDTSNEYKDEAEQHADAADRTKDPDLHKAAAESYRDAAEHMDDVPGGKKAAADLRGKADEHENIASRIIKATAAYAKSFLHANRTGNKADKSGTAADHTAAKDAHYTAASLSLTSAQKRHHEAEAQRHEKTAAAVDDKTSVSAA
jgi:hypothetical protein